MQRSDYAWPVTSVNKEDYDAFHNWFENYNIKSEDSMIYIFGAGIRGTEFGKYLHELKHEHFCYVDNNEIKQDGYINNKIIISPMQMIEKFKKNIDVILISVEENISIEHQLEEYGYKKNEDFYAINSKIYEIYLEEFLRIYNQKILVMGDCEFSKISLHDFDKRNLGEMLKNTYGVNDMKVLAMHGMGLRAHYNILVSQIRQGLLPELLVIMINFDTLNGKQHLLPRSQHEKLMHMIYDLSEKNDSEFEEYLKLVDLRSQNISLGIASLKHNSNKERNYMLLNYMYKLNTDVEGIVYLRKIFNLTAEKNIKVIPFLPPVNYELGRKLFGERFDVVYSDNAYKVKEIVNNFNYRLLDLSYSLTSEEFAEKNTPDETANENGRLKVCRLLIKRILEEQNNEG